MRINARLDEEYERKLRYLMRTTGAGVSDVVKQGIDVLYERERQSAARPEKLLKDAGLIGCFDGPADLSTRYKDELWESRGGEHDHR